MTTKGVRSWAMTLILIPSTALANGWSGAAPGAYEPAGGSWSQPGQPAPSQGRVYNQAPWSSQNAQTGSSTYDELADSVEDRGFRSSRQHRTEDAGEPGGQSYSPPRAPHSTQSAGGGSYHSGSANSVQSWNSPVNSQGWSNPAGNAQAGWKNPTGNVQAGWKNQADTTQAGWKKPEQIVSHTGAPPARQYSWGQSVDAHSSSRNDPAANNGAKQAMPAMELTRNGGESSGFWHGNNADSGFRRGAFTSGGSAVADMKAETNRRFAQPTNRQPRIDTDLGKALVGSQKNAASSRGVWSEQGDARVKTIYDRNGKPVYQKAWNKRTGEEMDIPSPGGQGAGDGTGGHGGHSGYQGPQHSRHRHEVTRGGPTAFSLALPIWQNNMTGSLSGTTAGGAGTIAEDNNLKAGFELAWPNWYFGYFPLRHNTTISGGFDFEGVTYTSGANLKFNSDIIEAYGRWDLLENHVFHLDWSLGVKAFFNDVVVTQGAATSKFDDPVPLPFLGLFGMFEIDTSKAIKGYVKYTDLEIGDAQATMLDAEIALSYAWKSDHEWSNRNEVQVGYKTLQLDLKDKSGGTLGNADVEFKGPYARVTAYF